MIEHAVDLRQGVVGDGFEWGRAGPATRVVRAAVAALGAVERPRPGLFARLFGAR